MAVGRGGVVRDAAAQEEHVDPALARAIEQLPPAIGEAVVAPAVEHADPQLAAAPREKAAAHPLDVAQGAEAEDLHLHVRIPSRPRPREGNTVGITLDVDRVFVFPISES